MKKILILASNPRKDLNLDDEIRLLRNLIERSRDRDRIEIVSEPGVQVGDLQGLLLRHKPQIVHFCGHGGGEEGLIFKTDEGGEQWVRADALATMFGLNPISSYVECVLLNACYSEKQADAIVSSIDYVVGMSHEIQDNAAIAFSKGFYLALGEGCSIDDSFEFGKNAIQLEISGSSKMRSAVTEVDRKLEAIGNVIATIVIPEHLKPILKKKPSLITTSNQKISEESRAAIQLDIDKSLEEDYEKDLPPHRHGLPMVPAIYFVVLIIVALIGTSGTIVSKFFSSQSKESLSLITGDFSKSCEGTVLLEDGHTLKSKCKDRSANGRETSLDLNNKIGNKNGNLTISKGYLRYLDTCKNIRLSEDSLQGDCQTYNKDWRFTSFNLNKVIYNKDGNLTFDR